MAINLAGQAIKDVRVAGTQAQRVMLGTGTGAVEVWSFASTLPVVTITGTSGLESRNQFRQACIDHGTTYQTVQVLPFLLDTSQATILTSMFSACSSLTSIPPLNTTKATSMQSMFSNCQALVAAPNLTSTAAVTNMRSMFYNCKSLQYVPDMNTANVTDMVEMFRLCGNLSDGNVRLIGKRSGVLTTGMIQNTPLTRLPFYDTNGNPI